MNRRYFGFIFALFFLSAPVLGRVVIKDVPLNQTKEWKQKTKRLQRKDGAVSPFKIHYLIMPSYLPRAVPVAFQSNEWTSRWYHLIVEASLKHGVPEVILMAVLKAESNFNPFAVSQKGAMGLMQLMPATGRELGVRNFFDPKENIDAGAKYLASLLKMFHSVELALAAYNAGPGAVKYYKGIPPYPETKSYVARVMSYIRDPMSKGVFGCENAGKTQVKCR